MNKKAYSHHLKPSSTFESNSVFDINTELKEVDYFQVDHGTGTNNDQLNASGNACDFPVSSKKIPNKTKSSIDQILKLESYLMDANVEKNYSKINDLINEMNTYDISNYRVEETESTFLHLAINKQRSLSIEATLLEILAKLVEKKCDPNVSDAYGWTILHYCCVYNLLKIARFLLSHQKLINTVSLNLKSTKQLKIGSLYFVTGTSPLQICAWSNNLTLGKLLVEHGANLHEKNDQEWTALHITARQGHAEFLAYLISHGISVNEANQDQNTALHIACKHGSNKSIVKLLLDSNSDISARNTNGESCLFLAVKHGHFSLVKLLLKSNANPNVVDYQENNCLHVCALLVEKKETLTSDEDEEKSLVVFKNVEIAKALLAYGCNLLKRNNIGRTCLHNCAKNNSEQLSALLISKSHSLVNVRDFYGQTALFVACKWRAVDCVRRLMRKNANRDVADLSGTMPIHLSAASEGSEEVLAVLLEFGDDVNKKTLRDYKETALHLAVRKNNAKTVAFLIEHKADLNKKNKDDWTPLHLACFHGAVESCFVLLSNGAKPNITDKFGNYTYFLLLYGVYSISFTDED